MDRRVAAIGLAAAIALVLAALGPSGLDDWATSRERPEQRWVRILDQFDEDGNGRLDERERASMRTSLTAPMGPMVESSFRNEYER